MLDHNVVAIPCASDVFLRATGGIAVFHPYDSILGCAEVRHVHPGDELAGGVIVFLYFMMVSGGVCCIPELYIPSTGLCVVRKINIGC